MANNMFLKTVIISACVALVVCQQSIRYTATSSGAPLSVAEITVKITLLDAGVLSNYYEFFNNIDSAAVIPNDCKYTASAIPKTGPFRILEIKINAVATSPTVPGGALFQDAMGTDIGCYLEEPSNGNYNIYLRGLLSNTTQTDTDNDFVIPLSASTVTNTELTLSGTKSYDTPQAQIVNPVSPIVVTYDAKLAVTDTSKAVITSSESGKPAYLKFTFKITNINESPNVDGARLHSCQVSDRDDFTGDNVRTFIGTDGCFITTTDFFGNSVSPTAGFVYSNSDSSTTGNVKTFIAYFLHNLEISGFNNGLATGSSNRIYFKCALTICDKDDGTCEQPHCTQQDRRRRETTKTDGTVTTSILVTRGNSDEQCGCTDSIMFQATMGSLSTLAVILFGVMTYTYLDLTNSINTAIEKKRNQMKNQFADSRSNTTVKTRSRGGNGSSRDFSEKSSVSSLPPKYVQQTF